MAILEIPEALAEQIRSAADAEGQDFNNYAVARLQEVFGTEAEAEAEADDPEVIAGIQRAMDAWDSGDRGQPVEEVFAEMDAKYGPVPTIAVKGK